MSEYPDIVFERTDPKARIPVRGTRRSAGFDLYACIDQEIVLAPGDRALIPLGVKCDIPEGHELQLRGRSGLAIRNGIGLVNGVGTIDSDYVDEIKAILINHGEETFVVKHGDRIVQGVVAPVYMCNPVWGDVRPKDSERNGGFGSTGV